MHVWNRVIYPLKNRAASSVKDMQVWGLLLIMGCPPGSLKPQGRKLKGGTQREWLQGEKKQACELNNLLHGGAVLGQEPKGSPPSAQGKKGLILFGI